MTLNKGLKSLRLNEMTLLFLFEKRVLLFCYNIIKLFYNNKEDLFMPYANNIDADQPMHSRSLISAFCCSLADSM